MRAVCPAVLPVRRGSGGGPTTRRGGRALDGLMDPGLLVDHEISEG